MQRFPLTSHPHQHDLSFILLILTFLIHVRWKLGVDSIWIFLTTQMKKRFLKHFSLLLHPMNWLNAAYVCMSIGPLPERGQRIRGHITEENWLSFTQKLSIFNSSTAKGGISWSPPPLVLGFCPAWTGLIYTVTALYVYAILSCKYSFNADIQDLCQFQSFRPVSMMSICLFLEGLWYRCFI